MKTNKKMKGLSAERHGFTLIELLIVIAIIGILASIVLVSLNSARQKANLAKFKSQVASLAPAAIVECDGTSGDLSTVETNGEALDGITAITITTDCVTGTGHFELDVTDAYSLDCDGEVTETGATFTGDDC